MSVPVQEARAGTRVKVAAVWQVTKRWLERHRRVVAVVGSLLAAGVMVLILNGHRDDFSTALSRASVPVLLLAALLQVVALVSRTEAWHRTIEAAGGRLARRPLYRASSMGYVGSLLNAQLGTAARITALRRSSPADAPPVPTLMAAELPILAVEAGLAAATSVTLIGPLGLPWWCPIIFVGLIGGLTYMLRRLSIKAARPLWAGLAVLHRLRDGRRLFGLVLIAVFAQIARNWLLLHAVGVNASIFDSIAVLIAMVAIGQLPVGPSVGAGATVLILGSGGVAAAAAAGVLATATGLVGGLSFAAWAMADRLWDRRRTRRTPAAPAPKPQAQQPQPQPHPALAANR
ncbi:lysylphosphatidylglycerol synthase domain-containing protein [Conexibacter woesei]|uniref:lysylphosphatidylglycerol synthase domain-containing protein n=1 Tax=Conexibacter woesei TaxID=191495 RepID=UPI0004271E6B|nr:lysylphosphatidylglycerol synthase domain-containing protein [Conexibacter woesei]